MSIQKKVSILAGNLIDTIFKKKKI